MIRRPPISPLFPSPPLFRSTRPAGGRIALDGGAVTAEPMYQRARAGIGYLAQEPSVFRKLTVEENIRAILETLPLDDAAQAERLERLLDEPAIPPLRRQKGLQPSGGARGRPRNTRAPAPARGGGGRRPPEESRPGPRQRGRAGPGQPPPASTRRWICCTCRCSTCNSISSRSCSATRSSS